MNEDKLRNAVIRSYSDRAQEYDDEGNVVPQPAYFIQVVIYAGINDNPVPAGVFDFNDYAASSIVCSADYLESNQWEPIANPHDGFNHDAADAPAPIDLDHSAVGHAAPDQADYITYLAITRRDDRALLWPSRFRGRKPYSNIVAIAQAHLFNDHSWDLWTPMWQCQMTPVTNYQRWVDRLDSAAASGESTPSISNEQMAALSDYLRSMESLADTMLHH